MIVNSIFKLITKAKSADTLFDLNVMRSFMIQGLNIILCAFIDYIRA